MSKPIPDINADRDGWFYFWDHPDNGGSGIGQLKQQNVILALRKTYPEWDPSLLDAAVRELWSDFVIDETGLLAAFDFLRPRSGLLDTITMRVEWMSM